MGQAAITLIAVIPRAVAATASPAGQMWCMELCLLACRTGNLVVGSAGTAARRATAVSTATDCLTITDSPGGQMTQLHTLDPSLHYSSTCALYRSVKTGSFKDADTGWKSDFC